MTSTPDTLNDRSVQTHALESPTQRLDRLLHASAAPLTGGLSPVSLSLAWADWAWHLAVSPGRQMELAALAAQLGRDTLAHRLGDGGDEPAGDADDDPRFRHPAWAALAVQRPAHRLPQQRGLLARGRLHAGHDGAPRRDDAASSPASGWA